jgi:hypothetical protein
MDDLARFCRTDYAKEAAEWVTGIGTLVLAAVAVGQETIRGWFYRPTLSVSIKTEPPDCMAVPERFLKPPAAIVEVTAVYLRILVRNGGNATALNTEVYVDEIYRKRTDGLWESIAGFPPMNLTWSDVGGMYFARIAPGMSKHCDVASIYDPYALAAVEGGPRKPELKADQTSLTFRLISHPNHKGNIVGPGDYRLHLTVAAENARPVNVRVNISLRGDWYSNSERMLRDGVGVSVEKSE